MALESKTGFMPRPSLSEKAFLQQIRELARWCGWLEYHPHDSRRSSPGYPDLCLCRPPNVIFAELKTATGRVTPAQEVWLQALGQCPGVETHVWRPLHWDAIVERLQRR
jgi:hypothetical protein